MELSYYTVSGMHIAELTSDKPVIQNAQDALDAIATAQYRGAEHLIWHQHSLHPDFFDLSTGLAGDILQKFSNYKMSLSLIGDFKSFGSQSLDAFIEESNKGSLITFVNTKDEALAGLSS